MGSNLLPRSSLRHGAKTAAFRRRHIERQGSCPDFSASYQDPESFSRPASKLFSTRGEAPAPAWKRENRAARNGPAIRASAYPADKAMISSAAHHCRFLSQPQSSHSSDPSIKRTGSKIQHAEIDQRVLRMRVLTKRPDLSIRLFGPRQSTQVARVGTKHCVKQPATPPAAAR